MAKRAQFVAVKSGTDALPWKINVPAALSESGKRERRFFATKSEAQTFANQQQVRIENFGRSLHELSPAQREAALTAFRLLGTAPSSRLVEIVRDHLAREQDREASVTLQELEKVFSGEKAQHSVSYRRQIRQSFWKLSEFTEWKVADLGAAEIDAALRGHPGPSRNLHLRVLRAAFNVAVKKKWSKSNPVDSLDFTVKRKKGEVAILSFAPTAFLAGGEYPPAKA